MPKEEKGFIKKHRNTLNFAVLLLFVFALGVYFWKVIRPKIILTSCTEIAVNTSHIQARTSFFLDTTELYEEALNECLYQAGVDPLIAEPAE